MNKYIEMNNFELKEILQSHPITKNTFVSVHSADTLPKCARKQKPCAYIANTDISSGEGEHWVCFYFPKNSIPEYFDSYGSMPRKSFEEFLNGRYIKNVKFIQHPLSTVCGQYTIFYIYHRCLGYSIFDIINMFDETDNLGNDKIVNNFIKRKFGKNLKVFDLNYLKSFISKALLKNY